MSIFVEIDHIKSSKAGKLYFNMKEDQYFPCYGMDFGQEIWTKVICDCSIAWEIHIQFFHIKT